MTVLLLPPELIRYYGETSSKFDLIIRFKKSFIVSLKVFSLKITQVLAYGVLGYSIDNFELKRLASSFELKSLNRARK